MMYANVAAILWLNSNASPELIKAKRMEEAHLRAEQINLARVITIEKRRPQ